MSKATLDARQNVAALVRRQSGIRVDAREVRYGNKWTGDEGFPFQVIGGKLEQYREVTTQNSLCADVQTAIEQLQRGEVATVRASDAFALRRKWSVVSGVTE